MSDDEQLFSGCYIPVESIAHTPREKVEEYLRGFGNHGLTDEAYQINIISIEKEHFSSLWESTNDLWRQEVDLHKETKKQFLDLRESSESKMRRKDLMFSVVWILLFASVGMNLILISK